MKIFATAITGLVAATLAFSPALAAERYETLPYALSPSSAPAETGTVTSNGAEIYYEIYGKSGDPILLIHGGAGNTETWGNQVNAWLRSNRVIVADTRGHGKSSADDQPFSYQLFADDFIALLDKLEIEKTAVVGWSDGGIIGIDLALRHPERLTKVVAYAANVTTDGVQSTVLENPTFLKYLDRARGEYARLSPTPDGYDAYLEKIGQLWATQPNWTAEELAKITTPILVLAGDHEEAISEDHTRKIAEQIPGSELVLLENTSHFAHLQDATGFNKAVADFLKE
ncbi:alpha/beta hydrolase [Devosia sp.]|uniref:alpha/beta fold hydrolase n=1 Tax=Devosia sp. TaxID=1871048 RepID=UPI0025DED603|nr:alpha/beta hydrolase [Devosia sp.]MCR6634253.1 alpha/beta hydrolase [Devosia sp.]